MQNSLEIFAETSFSLYDKILGVDCGLPGMSHPSDNSDLFNPVCLCSFMQNAHVVLE